MSHPDLIVRIDHWHYPDRTGPEGIEVSFIIPVKHYCHVVRMPSDKSLRRVMRVLHNNALRGRLVFVPSTVGDSHHWAYLAYRNRYATGDEGLQMQGRQAMHDP